MKAPRYVPDLVWMALLIVLALLVCAIDAYDRKTCQGEYAP